MIIRYLSSVLPESADIGSWNSRSEKKPRSGFYEKGLNQGETTATHPLCTLPSSIYYVTYFFARYWKTTKNTFFFHWWLIVSPDWFTTYKHEILSFYSVLFFYSKTPWSTATSAELDSGQRLKKNSLTFISFLDQRRLQFGSVDQRLLDSLTKARILYLSRFWARQGTNYALNSQRRDDPYYVNWVYMRKECGLSIRDVWTLCTEWWLV